VKTQCDFDPGDYARDSEYCSRQSAEAQSDDAVPMLSIVGD
jgi:hypothetical protein